MILVLYDDSDWISVSESECVIFKKTLATVSSIQLVVQWSMAIGQSQNTKPHVTEIDLTGNETTLGETLLYI